MLTGWHAPVHAWQEITKNWQPLSALAVSVVAVFVTWLQWKTAKKQWQAADKQTQTAKNQLRLALFERQFVVYEGLMRKIGIATRTDDVTHEQRQECAIATKRAEFLFNKEIDDYCLLLLREAVPFHVQADLMRLNQDPERDEARRRQSDHACAFRDRDRTEV